MTPRLRIFISTTDALSGRQDLLAPDEHARAQAMGSEGRRRQFCAGRALLRLALSEGGTRAPATWPIRLSGDRPQLDGPAAPQFSLSHSGHHVGCAISLDSPCGFDLQMHALQSRHPIAAEFFAVDDTQWLAEQPDFSSAFHRLWVLKEAWAKATGTPLLAALAHTHWQALSTRDAAVTPWHGGTAALSDTLTAGWVSDGADTPVDVQEWRDRGFVPATPVWTRWTLHSAPDSPGCDA